MVLPRQSCRNTALSLLTQREHSRTELLYKLSVKGFDASEIEHLLKELEAEDVLSDERYAESYVYARKQRGFGPLRIKRELQERGIAENIIEKQIYTEAESWLSVARQQYRKRFGKELAKDYKDRARQARFLQNRGFSSETIIAVLNEINGM